MPELDRFLETLSSGDPVPGGGTVAALQVALGAGLLAMVCDLTLGRAKFADVAAEIETIRGNALSFRDQARRLMDIDAEAYDAVVQARRLPRSNDDEKGVRRDAIQAALQGAARAPFETMAVAARGLEGAYRLASIGNPAAVSDVGTAALALHAGYHGARLNVEINLAAIKDLTFVDDVRRAMAALPTVDAFYTATLEAVQATIQAGA